MNMSGEEFKLKGKKHFVDDCFNLAIHVAGLQDALRQIAYSFGITGNEKMSEKLSEITNELGVVSDSIKEICAYRTELDTKIEQDIEDKLIGL
jgi:hypothetical protein